MRKIYLLLLFVILTVMSEAAISFRKSGGWHESAYAEWSPLSGYTDYHAYVRPAGGAYTKLDRQLIRDYGSYLRTDALGLTAGNYQLKIVPVAGGEEIESEASETPILNVSAHDRNGFAHFGRTEGVGAYNNDGTLKTGVKILYVHAGNAATIESDVVTTNKGGTTHCVGLQHILSAYEKGQDTTPLCIRLLGTIEANQIDSFGSKEEGLQIKGRKADSELNFTIEGVGNDAVIRGFGILVRNAASVELRNFAVMTAMDDAISLDTKNSHIWVHHIDGFYGGPGSDKDQVKGDGTIDVKSDSKYVTVSYNHFWDTGKSSMCGMKSETGPNYITYHHNWFDHSDSRHPRIRTMSVHIYNNYFDGNSKYCVGVTTGASAFVENNYFRNCPKPMLISMQGTDTKNGSAPNDGTFSKENGGIIKAFNNIFNGSKTLVYYNASTAPVHFDAYLADTRDEQVPADVTANQGGSTYNNFDTATELMPVITPDDPNDVPSIVTGDLGAGRMEHGDISFSFTNADDDSYAINNALAALVTGYTPALKGILGENGYTPSAITYLTASEDILHHNGTTISNPKQLTVRIYTANGVCVGSTDKSLIDISHLPNGTYIATTQEGRGIKLTK